MIHSVAASSRTVPSRWDHVLCTVLHHHLRYRRDGKRFRKCVAPGCCSLIITTDWFARLRRALHLGVQ